MAVSLFSRSLSSKTLIAAFFSRTFSTSTASYSRHSLSSLLRPLSVATLRSSPSRHLPSLFLKTFSTRTTSSSLNDPSPNWSNRPPKETILLDGCDFEHWLVVMDKPEGDPTRDVIIDSYIKTLAKVVGSEEEARMKIYSVSTRCYYAFGALVPEELSYKLKELPGVRWVLPDSYLDVKNKDYGGEPFINGQAVPYDPKYHEEWIRNNARANERNKRNSDRPKNFDRSRNFERRRENVQNRSSQPPPQAQGPFAQPPSSYGPPPQNNYGQPPSNNYGPPPPGNHMGGPPPPGNPMGGPQNNYRPPQQGNPMGGPPQNNYRPPQGNPMGGPPPPQNNFIGGPPPPHNNYMGGPQNMGRQPPNMGGAPTDMGGMPSNAGWNNNNMQQNFQNHPDNGGMQYEGAPQNYQNSYGTGRDGNKY